MIRCIRNSEVIRLAIDISELYVTGTSALFRWRAKLVSGIVFLNDAVPEFEVVIPTDELVRKVRQRRVVLPSGSERNARSRKAVANGQCDGVVPWNLFHMRFARALRVEEVR